MIFQKYSSSSHEQKILSWLCSTSPQFYWPEELLRAQLAGTASFVAQDSHQEVVAVLSFQALGENLWELQLIAVKEEHRGQGLAGKLFCWSLQELRVLNETRLTAEIWCEVHEQNSGALALYRRLGFESLGQRPRYYRDGGAAILMALKPGVLISS